MLKKILEGYSLIVRRKTIHTGVQCLGIHMEGRVWSIKIKRYHCQEQQDISLAVWHLRLTFILYFVLCIIFYPLAISPWSASSQCCTNLRNWQRQQIQLEGVCVSLISFPIVYVCVFVGGWVCACSRGHIHVWGLLSAQEFFTVNLPV